MNEQMHKCFLRLWSSKLALNTVKVLNVSFLRYFVCWRKRMFWLLYITIWIQTVHFFFSLNIPTNPTKQPFTKLPVWESSCCITKHPNIKYLKQWSFIIALGSAVLFHWFGLGSAGLSETHSYICGQLEFYLSQYQILLTTLTLYSYHVHNPIAKIVNDTLGSPMSVTIVSSEGGSFIHSLNK